MMSHVGFTRLVVRSSVTALLVLVILGSGCVEAGLQSGVFACNMDSQCPPGGFYCDNYFNSYMYFVDVNARPTVHNFWGHCNSVDNVFSKNGPREERLDAEVCTNGKDDDGDTMTDCNDLECQTAPACRTLISQKCTGGNQSAPCDNLLEFPIVRNVEELSDANCPKSVGHILNAAGNNDYCLPRCRLYFESTASSAGAFSGSDKYCDDIVQRFGTADEYSGTPGSMECVHLRLWKNAYDQYVQDDVCLPKVRNQVEDCNDCVSSGLRCVELTYRERTLLTFTVVDQTTPQPKLELKPVNGETSDSVLRPIRFCLTPTPTI